MDMLDVRQMTVEINILRENLGKKPVSEAWIRLLCREQSERDARGLVFIPAEKLNPNAKSSPYICSREKFDIIKNAIARMDGNSGRRKKTDGQRRAETPSVAGAFSLKAVRRKAAAKMARMLNSPPEDIHAAAGSVVNHMAGYKPCPMCGGEGCDNCSNGWIPSSHPVYESGEIAWEGDFVRLLDIPRQFPDAAYGLVMAWTHDTKKLDVMCVTATKRVIPNSEATIDTHRVQFVSRTPDRAY